MEENQQAKFSGWALLELFGHQKEIGHVTTVYFGDKAMFQVDIPALPEREYVLKTSGWSDAGRMEAGSVVKKEAVAARTRFISPGALYAMNPCTEEAAIEAMESATPRPVVLVKAPDKAMAQLIAPEDPGDDDDDQEEYADQKAGASF